MRRKINIRNSKINPVLYGFFLRLKKRLGAEIVHRRRRNATNYIEVIFHNEAIISLRGRLNTLREAESCGFWIICRHQTKRDQGTWHGRTVFQLFLSPVHPKKRRTALAQQTEISESVSFEPVICSAFSSKAYALSVRLQGRKHRRQREITQSQHKQVLIYHNKNEA